MDHDVRVFPELFYDHTFNFNEFSLVKFSIGMMRYY